MCMKTQTTLAQRQVKYASSYGEMEQLGYYGKDRRTLGT
jgi:hypothetical protein